jgi:hypothetical protein
LPRQTIRDWLEPLRAEWSDAEKEHDEDEGDDGHRHLSDLDTGSMRNIRTMTDGDPDEMADAAGRDDD